MNLSKMSAATSRIALALVLNSSFVCVSQSISGLKEETANHKIISMLSDAIVQAPDIDTVELKGLVRLESSIDNPTVPITLRVNSDGSTVATIDSGSGVRTEDYPARGMSSSCSKNKYDRTKGHINPDTCWSSTSWVLPTFYLKKLLGSSTIDYEVTYSDVLSGIEFIVWNTSPGLPQVHKDQLKISTERRVYLDPHTLLPTSMRYEVPAFNTRSLKDRAEVLYSEYREENGVHIPTRIQRKLNGRLIQDITIQTVSINAPAKVN